MSSADTDDVEPINDRLSRAEKQVDALKTKLLNLQQTGASMVIDLNTMRQLATSIVVELKAMRRVVDSLKQETQSRVSRASFIGRHRLAGVLQEIEEEQVDYEPVEIVVKQEEPAQEAAKSDTWWNE